MHMIFEYISAVFLMGGSFFCSVAALGVLRMPDVYIRLHASTKAGTLGLGMIMIGVAFAFNELTVTSRVIAILLFVLITAPVASHMLGRAALYMGMQHWKNPEKQQQADVQSRDADHAGSATKKS